MNQIVILDRQPVLRLGLKLLISENCKSYCTQEACNFGDFYNQNSVNKVKVFIIGFDQESEPIDRSAIKIIRKKYPSAQIILFGDYIGSKPIASYFRNGVTGHISKHADEVAIIAFLKVACD